MKLNHHFKKCIGDIENILVHARYVTHLCFTFSAPPHTVESWICRNYMHVQSYYYFTNFENWHCTRHM